MNGWAKGGLVHVLKNEKQIGSLPPGEWLLGDLNAFELALMTERGTAQISYYEKSRVNPEWLAMPALPGIKSILLIRSGAIGDLLLLSPCINEVRKKYSDAGVYLACNERHHPLFAEFNRPIQRLTTVPYPVPMDEVRKFDLIIPLEHVIELATEKGVHATDAFAEALGVTVTDYKPVYQVTEEERAWATDTYLPSLDTTKDKVRPRVAIQPRASAKIRDYPMPQWGHVIGGLLQRGWEVMMFGLPHQIPIIKNSPQQLVNCGHLTFRESAALLETCDVFCGVDSSFFNLCPALAVPAIGLFGPVDWRTRVKEGNGQVAISGHGECAPCGWTNSRAGQAFPPQCPSRAKALCEVLAGIPHERIIAKIDAFRK